MHMHTHAAAPGGSGCHSVAVRTGAGAVWACPTTGSPSYGRGSAGAPIKDQRTTHRMPRHDQQCPSSSSTQPNHNFQQVRNQFEEEVAGSLDQALKQLLSDWRLIILSIVIYYSAFSIFLVVFIFSHPLMFKLCQRVIYKASRQR